MTKRLVSTAKKLAIACVFSGMAVATATAANYFKGNACIVASTPACQGWSVGLCAKARFRPPNWNGSPNSTSISLFWGDFDFSQNFTKATGSLVSTTFLPVQASGIGGGLHVYNTTARIVGQVPATLVAATALLSNAILINGFDGFPGCTVTLRFQGQRYPLP